MDFVLLHPKLSKMLHITVLSLFNSDYPLEFEFLPFKSILIDIWQHAKIYSIPDS